jgi:hypothetical protein
MARLPWWLISAFGLLLVGAAVEGQQHARAVIVYGVRVAQLMHKNRLAQIISGLVIMSAGGGVVLIIIGFTDDRNGIERG